MKDGVAWRCDAMGCADNRGIKAEYFQPTGWRELGDGRCLCPRHAGCLTPNEVTTEITAEHRLAKIAAKALAADPTADEISVLELVVERMFGKGRVSYGPLRIALDERDFEQEALEELVDAPIYGAIGTIRRRRIRSAT